METSRPLCIGIILDGNRRWAKERGLSTFEGHKKGKEQLGTIARMVREIGIPHLVVYAFSTENWNRSIDEVSYLMDLFLKLAKEELVTLGNEGARIRFVGQRERFSLEIQEAMESVEVKTEENKAFTLSVCLSYGGRAEIVAAAKAAAGEGEITEESIQKHLWTGEMPDPDIIIRPGGEKRLSGFLTWQSVYSELFFVDTLWPDFGRKELDAVLAEFAERERRHGK